MAKLQAETTIILDSDDMNEILTESICRYGIFDDLEATITTVNGDGDFVVTLTPKPVEEKEAA